MQRKIAAIIAALFAAVTLMTATVFADSGTCRTVQTSYADKGETFTVEIHLTDNPGIRNISCNLRFNYQHLQFVSVEDAALLKGFYYSSNGSGLSMAWSGDKKKDTDATGLLATITFKVLDTPEDGSMIYNSVSAHSGNGVTVQIDGMTAIVYFGSERNDPVPQYPDTPEVPEFPDNWDEIPQFPFPDINDNDGETEFLDDSADETEFLPEETTPPTTAAPPTTTAPPKTTTAPKTTARPATTTTPTTTAPPTTTPASSESETSTAPEETAPTPPEASEPTTEATTEPTVIEEDVTTTTEESEPTFAEMHESGVNNKAANRGTLLIALMAIALTVVIVAAIEIYRRRR